MNGLIAHLRDHLVLSLAALAVALLIAVPAGAWIARTPALRGVSLAAIGTARVIPSLAILALMLPLVGIGFTPALVALVLLAIPPIAINTDIALRGVPADLKDAARGIGMSEAQVRRNVEWPLALPLAFAGVRTATVEVVASATLAAFIGGGGLGEYIVEGLAAGDRGQLLEGSVSVALLALAAQGGLTLVERAIRKRTFGAPSTSAAR